MLKEIVELIAGNTTLLLVVFAIFLVIAYKLIKIAMRVFVIALLSLLFPLILKFVFKINVPITPNSMLWFAITGVGLYVVYGALLSGLKILKVFFSALSHKKGKK